MIDLHKREGENEEQFIWRLCSLKDSGQLDIDWEQLALIINNECRLDESEYRDESAYRKPYQQAKRFYEAGVFKNLTADNYVKQIQDERRELYKEKQKLRDERIDYQRSLRESARKESFISLVERVFSKKITPLEFIQQPDIDSDTDLIVCLSDLHAGMNVKNSWDI